MTRYGGFLASSGGLDTVTDANVSASLQGIITLI